MDSLLALDLKPGLNHELHNHAQIDTPSPVQQQQKVEEVLTAVVGNCDDESYEEILNPILQVFKTYDEVEAALHDFSRKEGFEIVRGGGVGKKKGVIYKRRLICSKGVKREIGVSRGKRPTTRTRRSKLTGCPWSVTIRRIDVADTIDASLSPSSLLKKSDFNNNSHLLNQNSNNLNYINHNHNSSVDDNKCTEKWTFTLGKVPCHNHGRNDASGLANHRRRARSGKVQQFLKDSITAGIELKKARTLAYLRFSKDTENENMIISKDIYNESLKL